MIKAIPKCPTDLYGNIYIVNIQKAVVICLIIPIFPFEAGYSIKIPGCMMYVVHPVLRPALIIEHVLVYDV